MISLWPDVEEEVAVFADDADERGDNPRGVHIGIGESGSIIAIGKGVHAEV
jgi:hypothetical protein